MCTYIYIYIHIYRVHSISGGSTVASPWLDKAADMAFRSQALFVDASGPIPQRKTVARGSSRPGWAGLWYINGHLKRMKTSESGKLTVGA